MGVIWTVAGTAFVVVGSILAHVFFASTNGAFGFNPLSEAFPLMRSLTAAVAMLLGILANALWVVLSVHDADTPVDVRKALRTSIASPSFLRSALVSPIVFIAVYGLVSNEPDPVIAHLLAFQNGFFWEAVLRKAPKP